MNQYFTYPDIDLDYSMFSTSKTNIQMATYAQLKKQIEQLNKQAETARQLEKSATLSRVREAVAAFELTVEDVFGSVAKPGKTKTAKAAVPKRTPKGAGQAKYRDPKSGAVWTGFGRAPAWLASAKNRAKFLIAQPTAGDVNSLENTVAEPTKKLATKKASVAPKVQPAAKKTVKTAVAKVAKNALPEAPNAIAKAPAKKAVKVVKAIKPKTSTKASRKPAVKALPVATATPATDGALQDAATV